VKKIYVEQESLQMRGLSKDDLLELKYEDEADGYAEKDSIKIINAKEVSALMEEQDVILSF
jgi:tRNA 2-thiouridine synthesizing protein C